MKLNIATAGAHSWRSPMGQPASMPPTAKDVPLEPNSTQKRSLSDEGSGVASGGSEPGEITTPPLESSGPGDVNDGGNEGSTMGTSATVDDVATGKKHQKERRGWNNAATGTVRTSFSSFSTSIKTAPPKAPSSSAPRNSASSMAPPPERVKKAKKEAGSLSGSGGSNGDQNGTTTASPGGTTTVSSGGNAPGKKRDLMFQKQGHCWALPPVPDSESNIKDAAIWRARFCSWCEAFIALNDACTDSDANHALMVEAYAHWAQSAECLTKKQRKAAKAAAIKTKNRGKFRQLVKAALDGRGDKSPGDLGRTQDPNASGSPDQIPRDLSTGEENPMYLQRYFPGLPDDAIFCVLCASSGHCQDACPSRICRFCQTQGHPSYGCPTRRRCSKCKQLGHTRDDCQEKLALAAGEGIECAFCQAKDHTEAECVEFRRSYCPDENNIKRVKSLPIYCYSCGAEGHYGTQCGLSSANSRQALRETWDQANCQRYADQNSSEVAIVWDATSGVLPNGPAADERPDFGGKSMARRTHIVFEGDDDDGDEGFIRPAVQKPPAPGNIKIQMNNSGGGGTASRVNGHQGRGGKNQRNGGRPHKAPANPPLPPGPPPPLPPQDQSRPPPAPGAHQRGKKRKVADNDQKPEQGQGEGPARRGGNRPRRAKRRERGKA